MGGVITEAAGLLGVGPDNMYGGKGGGAANVNLTPGVTQNQVNASTAASLSAQQQQQALANQLQGQGGLQTQNAVLAQQQALANQLQPGVTSQTGAQNQQNILAQQQALANQLQGQASGQGPNPAQQQYQQNLNASTQAAAGTIASQKGISPALMAEMIARQQGSAGQNAAGTEATLQAQQQLAAQQQLQQQQATMQGTAQNQVGQQQTAVNQLANQQAQLQSVAGQQIGSQQNAISGLNTIAQGNSAQMLNANQAYAQNQVNMQSNINASNAGVSSANAAAQGNMAGGALNAAGGYLGRSAASSGGGAAASSGSAGTAMADSSEASDVLAAEGGLIVKSKNMPAHLEHISHIYHGPKEMMAKGGEIQYNKKERTDVKLPLAEGGEACYKDGALVPGKAKVDHNSYSNDNVKALLSPGEVVIPLDVMNSKDPVSGAAKFVEALLAKKDKTPSKHEEDFHSALKDAIKKRSK